MLQPVYIAKLDKVTLLEPILKHLCFINKPSTQHGNLPFKCLDRTYQPERPGGVCPRGLCDRGTPRCRQGDEMSHVPLHSTSWTEPPLWPNCSFCLVGNFFSNQLEKRWRGLRLSEFISMYVWEPWIPIKLTCNADIWVCWQITQYQFIHPADTGKY